MRSSGVRDASDRAPDRSGAPLRLHLLAGLPTEAVRRGFERAGEVMPVVPLDGLTDFEAGDETRIGVLLPPFVEPSLVVESWEACDFLAYRFGRPAHVASVSTYVDTECLRHHLASTDALASRGWGRGELDRRTVADIAVEQIESATQLVLVGGAPGSDSLARILGALNPGAPRIACGPGAKRDPVKLAAALGFEESGGRGAPPRRVARVVPPWLALLWGELNAVPGSVPFVYRRTRPFDLARLRDWLATPPAGLLRGKGHVWLDGESDQSFGYSCAGAVHRLYPAGRWWASQGTWPGCEAERRRLLERWHPRFGDRRQALVFIGVDLDSDRLRAGLDDCLVAADSVDGGSVASRIRASGSASTARLH